MPVPANTKCPPMLGEYWARVVDNGPILDQHWVNYVFRGIFKYEATLLREWRIAGVRANQLNVGFILGQRRSRWPNMKPTLVFWGLFKYEATLTRGE